MDEIEHLYFLVNKNGISITRDNTEAIRNAPPPKNVKELQSSIGAIHFYRHLIPGMASLCKPLYTLLKKDITWHWGRPQHKDISSFEDEISLNCL